MTNYQLKMIIFFLISLLLLILIPYPFKIAFVPLLGILGISIVLFTIEY